MVLSFNQFKDQISSPFRPIVENSYVKRVTGTIGNNFTQGLDFFGKLSQNVQGTILNTSGLLSNSTTYYIIIGLAGTGVLAYGYSKLKN
jgi:hypothetical protein